MRSSTGTACHRSALTALRVIATMALLFGARAAAAEDVMACGSLDNAYGPYDYADAVHRRDNLPIVEQFHFTSGVETLTRARSGTIMGDLDYTLRAFPNHHRALDAMARYQLAHPLQAGSEFRTADCYFDRAMRWRPNDATVRLIYGIYLVRKGDKQEALQRYKESLALDAESADAHYNIGLLYCDLSQLDAAREHAVKAYQLGYPLPGLRNRLMKLGAWQGGAAAPATKPAAAAPVPGQSAAASAAPPPG